MAVKDKHPHYHKNVAHLATIDVYRVLERFGVVHPTIQHAVKKLLAAGQRGAGKDQLRDVNEAIDSLNRFCEMYNEDAVEQYEAQLNFIASMPAPAEKPKKGRRKATPRRGR